MKPRNSMVRLAKASLMAFAFAVASLALGIWGAQDGALAAPTTDRVGDAYEITIERKSEGTGDDGSSSSSFDRDTAEMRVIGLRDGGAELAFDLPANRSAEDRARDWKLPARVLKLPGQPLRLLNEAELEARLEAWLQAGWGTDGRKLCGRWIFTWTAIKIECDPQSVLTVVQRFILEPTDLHDGAEYSEPGAKDTARLRMETSPQGAQTFAAELELDEQAMRRDRAESDVVVAQIMGRPALSIDEALQVRASETVSGSVKIVFETDAAGRVTRRTRVIWFTIVDASGATERNTVTETATERRLP